MKAVITGNVASYNCRFQKGERMGERRKARKAAISLPVSILRAYPWERSELRVISSSSRRCSISCGKMRRTGVS